MVLFGSLIAYIPNCLIELHNQRSYDIYVWLKHCLNINQIRLSQIFIFNGIYLSNFFFKNKVI